MPQLIVRQIEATVVRKLRSRAAAQGVSVEEAHRQVLRQALLGPQAAHDNFIEYLQSMPAGVEFERLRDLPRNVKL
jgi:plasmid stability protein